MKIKFITLLAILFSAVPFLCTAQFASSGHVEYKWLHDSTYKITFKYFHACQSGVTAPDTVALSLYNNCTNTCVYFYLRRQDTKIISNNRPNGAVIPVTCDPSNNICNSSSGSFASGIREWWYDTTLTVPLIGMNIRCQLWKFGVSVAKRTDNDNLSRRDSMYVETSMQFQSLNDISHNSSPEFDIPPFFVACNNRLTRYNNKATDPDNDVLTYEIINPKRSANSCMPVATNSQVAVQTPPIQFATNPSKTNNSFSLDTVSGTATLTPQAGTSPTSVITYLITEHRGSSIVGTMIRDVQYATVNCSNPTPTLVPVTSSINGASYNNNILEGCMEQPMQMCFDIKSNNGNALLRVSDDHNVSIPASAINYSNQSTNSVRACFTWTPSLSDEGTKSVLLEVIDSTCNGSGIIIRNFLIFTVHVAPKVVTNVDTVVCKNEPVVLKAKGGYGNYTWQIMPGGTAGSLSCINCDSTTATPQVNTKYIVSAPGTACIGNKHYYDTVTLYMSPAQTTNPGITLSVLPDSFVQNGKMITFSADVNACTNREYQWLKNGVEITGANGSKWSSNSLAGYDIITCKLTCTDSCPMPRTQVSAAVTLHYPETVSDVNGDYSLWIYPNPNNGQFTIGGLKYNMPDNLGKVKIMNVYGQIVPHKTFNNNQQITIDNAASGVYFMRYTYLNHTGTTRFIIK